VAWWVWALVAYWSLLVLLALWAAVARARPALRSTRGVADAELADDGSASPQVEAA
jgi:hypothetical protein